MLEIRYLIVVEKIDYSFIRQMSHKHSIQGQSLFFHHLINLMSLVLLGTLFYWVAKLFGGFSWWLSIPIQALIFGFLLFGFFILVVHEASHHIFFYTQNKKLRILLNRMIAYPISAISFQDFIFSWEEGHNRHHRKPIDLEDPQNCPGFCLVGGELLKEILKVIFIPGHAFKKQSSCLTKTSLSVGALFQGLLVWTLILFFCYSINRLDILISLLIGSNITMALNLVKVSLEHGGRLGAERDLNLRSKSSRFYLRWIFMPFNISIHFEHHLCPLVPWYRLGLFSDEVLEFLNPEQKEQVYNLGYSDSLNQLKKG